MSKYYFSVYYMKYSNVVYSWGIHAQRLKYVKMRMKKLLILVPTQSIANITYFCQIYSSEDLDYIRRYTPALVHTCTREDRFL